MTRSRNLTVSLLTAAVLPIFYMPIGAQSQESAGVLEEVVVTARKREESLQEVPIAVTAFSENAIASIGVKGLEDIALRTPGLQFSEQAGQIPGRFNCSIRFRGMNVNSEQPVAQLGSLFIDGIYVASGCNSLGAEDLARIEVVKGPQAVYFGRNTFGGAVNYVTKDPGNDWGGKVTGSFAEDDDIEVTGSFEGPIIADKLAFRLSSRYYDRGGIYGTTNDGTELGEQKTRSVAAKLVFTPNDAFTLRVRGQYAEDRDGPPGAGFISGNLNDTCTGTTSANGTPRGRYICGTIPGIDAANTVNANGNLISYNTSLSPASFPMNPNYLFTQLINNGANDPAIADALGIDTFGLKRNMFYVGATADWELPNDWTLSGVFGHNEMRANWIRDFDFTDTESWWSMDPQSLDDDTYELRLTSAQDGKFSWVAGVSYYEMAYTQSGNGGTALTAIPIGMGVIVPSTFRNSLVNNVEQTYSAFFGGLTYKFTDQWSASLEARYQIDEIAKGQTIAAQVNRPIAKAEWKDLLPRAILQWQPTPETNLYASYSKGVLPGDINAEFIYGPDNMRSDEQIASARDQTVNGAAPYPQVGFPDGTPGIAEAADFIDREKLDSFELGWKQQWLNGRLQTNMAFYYMEWENQKGRVSAGIVDFNGNTNAPYVRDAATCTVRQATDLLCNDTPRTVQISVPGSSELKGIEFEGNWFATDNLSLQAGLEYTNNKYTAFTFNFVEALAGTREMKGNTSPRYPEFKGNLAVNYTAPLAQAGWEWFTRGDLLYFGEYFVDESNLATAPAQTLLNARIGVKNDNMRLELFGYNLTDEDAYASASRFSDFSIPGNFAFTTNQGINVAPQRSRYFGVKATYTF
ncbi:MAG: TonB-dependent receptor [Steroidobacteraceae bacterium]